MKKVLIIDREISSRELLMELLGKERFQLFSVEDGVSALTLLKTHPFDLVFSDLSGIEVLKRFKSYPLETPLIFLQRRGDKEEEGVAGVLRKPIAQNDLSLLFCRLKGRNSNHPHVIAHSPQMKRILERVEKIAESHSNVFIQGESGTGKEVIAALLHSLSRRSSYPFIKVNCAALPDTLIESEFFGHEKGAFTGALSKRIGRFERADHGTLLLDEISEIPPSLQAKLLRVIQEQEFERVGGMHPIHVDVRIVSTSNRHMKEAIVQKQFREDLYYRLNVVPIYLPPLRERVEDLLPLVEFFLKEICGRNQMPLKKLSKDAEKALMSYEWPGNSRELRNVIEHSVIMASSDIIEEKNLFFDESFVIRKKKESLIPFHEVTLKELEKNHILEMLKQHDGNRTKAAEALGISVRTLRNKLDLYRSKTS
jgi:two-component system response regulator AtoC